MLFFHNIECQFPLTKHHRFGTFWNCDLFFGEDRSWLIFGLSKNCFNKLPLEKVVEQIVQMFNHLGLTVDVLLAGD